MQIEIVFSILNGKRGGRGDWNFGNIQVPESNVFVVPGLEESIVVGFEKDRNRNGIEWFVLTCKILINENLKGILAIDLV